MTGSDRRSESEVVRVSPRRRWWWWQRSSSLSSTSSSSSSLRGAAGVVVPALATARAPDRQERERRYRVFLPRASSKSDSPCRTTATSSLRSLSPRQQLARIAARSCWRGFSRRDVAGVCKRRAYRLVKCIRCRISTHTYARRRVCASVCRVARLRHRVALDTRRSRKVKAGCRACADRFVSCSPSLGPLTIAFFLPPPSPGSLLSPLCRAYVYATNKKRVRRSISSSALVRRW